jgi:hypothetical protein
MRYELYSEDEMTSIWTIGYAADYWDGFWARLAPHGFTHLVDVRTNPYSRYQEDFRGSEFEARVNSTGLKYVFFGDRLGGKPDRPEVLTDGELDPEKLVQDEFFRGGIRMLTEAAAVGSRKLCLMCGCGKPHECHRGRILGPAIVEAGFDLRHLLPDGRELTQADVELLLGRDQLSLF